MEKNWEENVTIALNVLSAKNIYPVYVLKYNSNRKNNFILLIISNGEKQWHYVALKILSTLLRGIGIRLVFIV